MTVRQGPRAPGGERFLLIGGGLHRRGPDLTANARHFVDLLEAR